MSLQIFVVQIYDYFLNLQANNFKSGNFTHFFKLRTMEIHFNDLNTIPIFATNPFEKKVIQFVQEWFSDTPTVSVQTSGSTGVPKVFEVEKKKMRYSAEMTCRFLELKHEDSALLCLPVEYISGKMMIVRSIERKLRLHITEPSLHPLQNLETEIDFCAMTPLQVEHSLDKIHLIKKLIIGGAAVSEALKKKINEKLLQRTADNEQPTTIVYETYGMSETLSHIALKEIFPNEQQYFQLFQGVEISQDPRGCLTINAPQLNSEILQTNDIIELKNTQEFRFLGRADHIINSGGAKIYPEQLEAMVKKVIPNEVVFLGIPDERLGQKLILVVEGTKSVVLNEKLSNIHYQPKFHQPKEIVFVEKIPRTPNGKVNRRALLDFIQNS